MNRKKVSIEVTLSDWSNTFISAFFRLMEALEHADQAMLEDEIREAHAELVRALQKDGMH